MSAEPPGVEKWNARYRDASVNAARPARVLTEFAHLLPATGDALDLACGLGANALFLAARMLRTSAWDLSPVAIGKLRDEARRRGVPLTLLEGDVKREPPAPESLDVIVVSHFLERALVPNLIAALRPAGLVFYQTFTRVRVDDTGPPDGPYRLAENELLRLFGALQILVYREEGRVGDLHQGFRNEAMLVGRKWA